MSDKKEEINSVRSGFTAQQSILIIAAFLLGMISATTFKEVIIERGFGPAPAIAASDSQNDPQ